MALLLIALATGWFKTGCSETAQAANVMLTRTYSFTTIQDVTVTEVVPPSGATGVARTQIVSISFTHPLPVVSATVVVKADGTVWAGTQVMTTITGGKKIVWTPTEPFPMYSNITWELNATVNNGL